MPYRQTDRRLVRFVTASSRSGTRRFGGEARKIACRGRECKSSLTNGCQCRASFIPGQANALPSNTRGGSRMPESGSSGSVRGALRNERPYRERDSHPDCRCAGETGKEQVVQVHCDEGVATRIGPKPCAYLREEAGEASVGVRTGQPLSRENWNFLGAD